jgi:hypothetical protein
VTEDEVRAVLAAFDGLGGPERRLAEQRPWQVTPRGWKVPGELQGWAFCVGPAPGGVQVIADATSGEPARWLVPATRAG